MQDSMELILDDGGDDRVSRASSLITRRITFVLLGRGCSFCSEEAVASHQLSVESAASRHRPMLSQLSLTAIVLNWSFTSVTPT